MVSNVVVSEAVVGVVVVVVGVSVNDIAVAVVVAVVVVLVVVCAVGESYGVVNAFAAVNERVVACIVAGTAFVVEFVAAAAVFVVGVAESVVDGWGVVVVGLSVVVG